MKNNIYANQGDTSAGVMRLQLMKVKESFYKEVCRCEDNGLYSKTQIEEVGWRARAAAIRECLRLIDQEVKL